MEPAIKGRVRDAEDADEVETAAAAVVVVLDSDHHQGQVSDQPSSSALAFSEERSEST